MGRPNEETVTYIPAPTIQRFFDSKALIRGIMGPVGSGKSTACCMEIMRRATMMPPDKKGRRRSRWAGIRGTYRELQDTTIKTWLEWFPEVPYGKFHHNDMTHYINFRMGDGTTVELEVLFRAMESPADIKKLKSMELTGVWINEAVEIPKEIVDVAETRVKRYPRKKDVPVYDSFVIMDTNPPDTEHWWYKLAEEFVPKLNELRARGFDSYQDALAELYAISGSVVDVRHMPDEKARAEFMKLCGKYEFFRQPSGLSAQAENTEWLDQGYYTSIALGKPQEWINVFVHGNYGYVQDGKPVYPEYIDGVHYHERLTGPDKNNKIIIRGWDGGRTPACILTQVTPHGRLFAFDEVIGFDTGLDEFGDRVKKHCSVHYPGYHFSDIGDPSIRFKSQLDNRSPATILAAKGINMEYGRQEPTYRKESVKKLLREMINGQPAFAIGPNCKMLRKGLMGGYQYKRKQVSGTEYHEKPSKNEFSHPVDAFEYICTRLYAGSITDEDFDYEDIKDEFFDRKKPTISPSEGRNAVTGY